MSDDLPIYGPDELAEKAGVSRRTVRYYVQRGLLPAPSGLGRGKHYTEAHLARLIEIRELQAAGVPLEQVGSHEQRELLAPAGPRSAAIQSAWTRIVLSPDVELHVRGRRLSESQVEKLQRQIQQTIGGDES